MSRKKLPKDPSPSITEQKKIEEHIRTSEERFKALIKYSSDAIILITQKGSITYASDSVYQATGYRPEEVVGSNVITYIHPQQHEKFKQLHSDVCQQPGKQITVEYQVQHKNGTWIWVEATGVNYFDNPHIQAIIVNFRNITERKRTETNLAESNQTLQAIIQASPLAVYVVDNQGKILMWNKACEMIFGWKEKEIKGKVLPIVLPEYNDEFKELMHYLLAGRSFTRETVRRKKDGTLFDVSISASPILDDAGKTVKIVAITSDISERKTQERQKEEFIGIVSHELKTPVTSLKAYEQALQRRFLKAGDATAALFLQRMDSQINKMTMLINDLLDVTKIEAGKMQLTQEEFQLDELIEEIIEEVQRTTDTHAILLEGTTNTHIMGDRYRIGQVLTNLLTNAIKYSPEANKVIVRSQIRDKQVLINVVDFGEGIDKELQSHIFERFFRATGPTESTFPGLGLGLYISHEIITRQGGKIWVESEKGKGSTFYFSLPIPQM